MVHGFKTLNYGWKTDRLVSLLHGILVTSTVVQISDVEVENCDLNELSKDTMRIIEADSYWCTSKLLDGIQDNYTFAQPGIQMKVNALRELMKRIDGKILKSIDKSSLNLK